MGGLGVPDWLLPAELGAIAEPLGAQHLLSSLCIRCPRLGSITPFTAPMVMLDITSGRFSPPGIRNCKSQGHIKTDVHILELRRILLAQHFSWRAGRRPLPDHWASSVCCVDGCWSGSRGRHCLHRHPQCFPRCRYYSNCCFHCDWGTCSSSWRCQWAGRWSRSKPPRETRICEIDAKPSVNNFNLNKDGVYIFQ